MAKHFIVVLIKFIQVVWSITICHIVNIFSATNLLQITLDIIFIELLLFFVFFFHPLYMFFKLWIWAVSSIITVSRANQIPIFKLDLCNLVFLINFENNFSWLEYPILKSTIEVKHHHLAFLIVGSSVMIVYLAWHWYYEWLDSIIWTELG